MNGVQQWKMKESYPSATRNVFSLLMPASPFDRILSPEASLATCEERKKKEKKERKRKRKKEKERKGNRRRIRMRNNLSGTQGDNIVCETSAKILCSR
ncbi:hypothetical protein OS493_038538 [Desmophyllum pertusum]|uniref:Uncharacterized protein n=1 Tax=Desmophyllum pertusum TaxID=174260 RepID=A0A9W9Y6X2_9CNID|nr:hypothetical protein OS493_038538 [Desmophyllum pertusum]